MNSGFKCLQAIFTNCTTQVRVIESTRLSSEILTRLLTEIPNFKLLYILRDPRGILSSYLGIETTKKGFNDPASLMCKRMLNDLKNINELKRIYPQSVRIIFLENLVENALEAEQVFKFAGVPFIDTGDVDIDKQGVIKRDHGAFGNFAHAWREKLTFNSIQEIDRNCLDVYEELNLNYIVTEEQLKDPNFSTLK